MPEEENYVVSEVAKSYLNCGVEPYMYYYRDKDAKEIDIVLEHDGILAPIEIKKTSSPDSELGAIDRDNYIVPIWMI